MALLFAADDKFADVIAVLEARGWRRLPYVGCPKAHLKWTNYSKLSWPRVAPTQLVNHFQHAVLFSRKDQFAELLYAHGADQNGGQVSVDGCFPRTFDLSQLLDRRRLRQWFLYTRAVAVLKQSASADRAAPEVDRALLATAMALTTRVLSNERAFTDWRLEETTPAANSSEKEGSLDVDAPEWQLLLSPPTECQALNREDSSTRGKADALLEQLTQRDPQITAIGSSSSRSVWICKPANLSQGRGIVLCTSLEELEALSNTNQQDNQDDALEKQQPSTAAKWIVQKYVERPLLLQHGRKFDIRQWVLVTAITPEPTAFWYHRSYLRFCGRKFSLSRLQDRFTHLSNYSVQRDFVAKGTDQEAGKPATGLQPTDDDRGGFELMWSSELILDSSTPRAPDNGWLPFPLE
ncbi:hypothetical protein BBJ28_00024249 [Nothophytophthora sp. Chile5]|nr:hypothetical protein BBJ28_00024249 [Nothophytophthora sp. Chile5]